MRRVPIVRLTNGAGQLGAGVTVNQTRQLTLNEVLAPKSTVQDPVTGLVTNYPGGPMEILVNNTKWDGGVDADGNCIAAGLHPDRAERRDHLLLRAAERGYHGGLGDRQHNGGRPSHAHPSDVQFQVLNRQPYNTRNYLAAYNAAFPGGLYLPALWTRRSTTTRAIRCALGGNPDITPFLSGAGASAGPGGGRLEGHGDHLPG